MHQRHPAAGFAFWRFKLLHDASVLVPGATVWIKTRAPRAAVFNDAADYFAALRQALLRAQRQVHIVGWDIHSETPLVGASGPADDGLPVALAPFLQTLLARRQGLKINILIWDYVSLYAAERERNSAKKFTDGGNGRIRFCRDGCLPLGSAQHQKFVVIDDQLAFVGGIDLTIRRWDTSEHLPQHPFRRDPQGRPYPPFHDIQCMVDGDAAAALGRLARRRWRAAGCAIEAIATDDTDSWPPSVLPQARDIAVGIARTEVDDASLTTISEVEELFARSIETANDFIYIENQFISADAIGALLAQRMRDVPALKVVIVAPRRHSSWLESQAMLGSRGSFLRPFEQAGVTGRLRLLYPSTQGVPVMVHSKLMIVDNDFLRIGSANINNRSLGADSECDLALEASTPAHREFIRNWRRHLIGHFCGLDAATIAQNEDRILQFLDRHRVSGAARTLRPVEHGPEAGSAINDFIKPIADPKKPLNLQRAARRMWTLRTVLVSLGLVAAFIGLALAWRHTSLRDLTDIEVLSALLAQHDSPLAPLLVVVGFVLGGLLVFPVVVLIAATAAALGPWKGAVTAIVGVALSAFLMFMVGRYLGHERLQSLLGPRALRIQKRLVGKGVIAIAILRLVPVAPFSVVNVLAGASQLKPREFILGTVLGMMPGIVAMAALGSQIADFARNASWQGAILVGLIILAWIAVCLGAQFVVTWMAGRKG